MKMDLSLIEKILDSRPRGNLSLEQYLMKKESVVALVEKLGVLFSGREILFLGDDDHVSILLSFFFGTYSFVIDIDERIVENHMRWVNILEINNKHKIYLYDIRDDLTKVLQAGFKGFHINPPYCSKSSAYGIKVWISKALHLCSENAIGSISIPILFEKNWSLKNFIDIQSFLSINNCLIYDIDRDTSEYHDLPAKDIDLKSSSVFIKYLGGADNLLLDVTKNLYR